jgi:uncharacterized protein YutE (UPF0331/DUF86 family)
MNVNTEKIKARAADIAGAIEKVKTYANLPDEQFWADERNLYSVKYLLLQAMEAAGSICVHVMAKEFQQAASNYAACFEKLAACEVISAELSSRLRKMIRFRNILLHRYWEVDDSRILEYARKDLQDLHDLLSAVWTFLGIK